MPALDPKRALTVLTRLAARRPSEAWELEQALKGRLDALAVLALEVGAETGDPIGKAVASVLGIEPNATLAERLVRLLPAQTVALRELAVEVIRQCLEHERSRGDNAGVAMYATNMANRLSELGRREDAL